MAAGRVVPQAAPPRTDLVVAVAPTEPPMAWVVVQGVTATTEAPPPTLAAHPQAAVVAVQVQSEQTLRGPQAALAARVLRATTAFPPPHGPMRGVAVLDRTAVLLLAVLVVAVQVVVRPRVLYPILVQAVAGPVGLPLAATAVRAL